MSGNPAVPGKTTIQLRDDGSMHYESWGPGPDGEMFKTMVIHSTRR